MPGEYTIPALAHALLNHFAPEQPSSVGSAMKTAVEQEPCPLRPVAMSLCGLVVSQLCELAGTRKDGTPTAQSSLWASLPVRQRL